MKVLHCARSLCKAVVCDKQHCKQHSEMWAHFAIIEKSASASVTWTCELASASLTSSLCMQSPPGPTINVDIMLSDNMIEDTTLSDNI